MPGGAIGAAEKNPLAQIVGAAVLDSVELCQPITTPVEPGLLLRNTGLQNFRREPCAVVSVMLSPLHLDGIAFDRQDTPGATKKKMGTAMRYSSGLAPVGGLGPGGSRPTEPLGYGRGGR